MKFYTKSGQFSINFWRADLGPALERTETYFGRAWFHWFPRPGWRDWRLMTGRMRVASIRWLQWHFELCYICVNKFEGNVTPIRGGAAK
jgi:hypothetical protein